MKYDLCFLENNRIFLRGTTPQVAKQKKFSHNRTFLAQFSSHIYHAFPCDILFYCESYIYICAAAAAAAKSLQLCPTLCDPRDGSPPGSPVPGFTMVC